ncbi:MAG: bifunctional 4-hydroxy-2-oxoglutarate aldolase/2-dehydro-3-deoxy-phosphogluconate aldolase [Aggregatilineales bacterium]
MPAQAVKAAILSQKIVTIVRGPLSAQIEIIAATLAEEGLTVIEVTLNSPGALRMIEKLAARFSSTMQIGAGTVLTPQQVDQVREAGASFTVSPDTCPPVIRRALSHGLLPLPGAYTATEIRRALRAGAELIKLFPAVPGGPEYLRQMRGPFDDALLIPTGGVTPENIPAFLAAGAAAFGVGRELVVPTFDGSRAAQDSLRQRAQRFKAALAAP